MPVGSTLHTDSRMLVQARGIMKSFGEGEARIPVLKGVDLDVAMGEILLLVGPSGSGKTTLLSVIAGILESDGGDCHRPWSIDARIVVFGQDRISQRLFWVRLPRI